MFGRLLSLFLLSALLLPGAVVAESASAPACASGEPLTVGVFPRRNPATTDKMFAPLAAYLERRLGCPVHLVTAKDFALFWEGVKARRYDLVHYNQFHYVRSADAYQVILRNEEFGSDLIAGVVYVRSEGGPTRLEGLRGATVVFGGGPDAMMSHIVPRHLLLQAGLQPQDYQSVYAPNPPNAVLSVYYGKADAAGGGDVVEKLPAVTRLVEPGKLSIIARSEPLHHLPWGVRRGLPEPLVSAIRRELLALNDSAEGRTILESAGLTGLTATSDADYDDCRAIIREVEAVMPLEQAGDATP